MTNEEAIKRLKEVQAEFNENWVDYGGINQAFEKAYKALEERPTTGEWVEDSGNIACSHCHTIWLYRRTDFCPYCGADMRKEAEND